MKINTRQKFVKTYYCAAPSSGLFILQSLKSDLAASQCNIFFQPYDNKWLICIHKRMKILKLSFKSDMKYFIIG